MVESSNRKLKAYLDDLSDTYKDISFKTDIPVRTLYNIVEEGASIKFDYLKKLADVYGFDLNSFATNERWRRCSGG